MCRIRQPVKQPSDGLDDFFPLAWLTRAASCMFPMSNIVKQSLHLVQLASATLLSHILLNTYFPGTFVDKQTVNAELTHMLKIPTANYLHMPVYHVILVTFWSRSAELDFILLIQEMYFMEH